jgi:hypothetical protein
MAIAASGADSVPSVPLVPSAVTARSRTSERRRALPINIPAAILVVGGAVLQGVALADSIWLDSPTGRLGFEGFKDWAQPGFAQAFVSWVAWVLLGVTLVFGIAACVRWNGASMFRYLGAVFGVAGAFMTVGAVLLIAYQTDDNSFHVARNYAAGPYLAVLGLLASALGAAAGTGRRG